jgi:four helix bundle protein
MKTHKELDVWKLAIEFVTNIYKMTSCLPSDEKFGLSNQLRRAAISIPSNVSKGFARKGQKETVQFLYVSLGSHSEIETQLIIARNLNYFDAESLKVLEK